MTKEELEEAIEDSENHRISNDTEFYEAVSKLRKAAENWLMVLEMGTYQGLYQAQQGRWESYQTKKPGKRFTGLTPEAVLDVLAQDTQDEIN